MRGRKRHARYLAGLSAAGCGLLLGAASLAQPAQAATRPVHKATVHAATRVVAKPARVGTVSFTFDDGLIGQYTYARPALIAAHLHGTFYIISDAFGWGKNNMSAAQVRRLVADGDEIGNHTRDHPDLTSMSDGDVQAEFADAQRVIRAKVGVTPTTCAYPHGASNASVQAIAASNHLKACRGTSSGTNKAGSLHPYDLVVKYVHTETTAADIRRAASAAKAANAWVIFVYHGIGNIGSDDDVTAAQFRSHVQAVKASGVAVKTVSQALTVFGR